MQIILTEQLGEGGDAQKQRFGAEPLSDPPQLNHWAADCSKPSQHSTGYSTDENHANRDKVHLHLCS